MTFPFRSDDFSRHRAGRDHRGTGQIHLALPLAHAPAEVAVACADDPFPRGGHAEMVAHAGPAAGRADHGPGFDKGLNVAFFQSLLHDFLAGGNDDEPGAGRDFAHGAIGVAQLRCSRGQVRKPPVGTGADEGFMDVRTHDMVQGIHVGRAVGPGHRGRDLIQVDFQNADVGGVGVWVEGVGLDIGYWILGIGY